MADLRRVVFVAAAAAVTAGCLTHAGPQAVLSTAGAQLGELVVRVEDTGAHYDRDEWGDWTYHGEGCDTRELTLRRDGVGWVATAGCRPVCPEPALPCWYSPYDGATLRDPRAVQIDHLVALKEASRSGTRDWTPEQRQRFANDPANLRAVSASSNASKGDRDPGRWRPPNRAAWCDFASGYVTVKRTYQLTVDQAERDALAAMLGTCLNEGRP